MPKITLNYTDKEYREAWIHAMYRHVGGQYPVNSYIKQSSFGYMQKYPLSDAARASLEERYAKEHPDANGGTAGPNGGKLI